jgi:putative FmdB family regulatory protein
MPLFEYRCRVCHAEFELLVRSGETPACPECRTEDLEKLLSGFAVGQSAGTQHACGCGGPDDCIGNQAAAARARGKASCC